MYALVVDYLSLTLQHPFSFSSWIFLAEKFLESVEGNQNYPLLLLTLLEKSQDNVIRVCAAVTFKNFIKRNWRIVSFAKNNLCHAKTKVTTHKTLSMWV